MAKVKKKKRIIRQDQVTKELSAAHGNETHGAYAWMRRVKEGHLPPGNTNLRKTLDAVELELIHHFGELNGLQQVQLNLLRPLLCWWLLHPGTVGDDGKLAVDFKWIHSKIESGLKVLCDLAEKQPCKPVESVTAIIAEAQEQK